MFIVKAKGFFAPENEEGAEPEEVVVTEEGEEPDPAEGDEPEEGEEPAEGAEGDEGDEPEEGESAAPVRRGETRFQKLANEAREERDKRIRAEARAEALEQTRTAQSDNSAEAARVRAEKLALMDPTERELFETREVVSRLEQNQQVTNIRIADYTDKTAYEAKAATNSVYAKHKDWVENALAAERKAGRNPSRELLLRFKIGEDALSAKPSKKQVAAKEAAVSRVQSAKGAPVSARGDVGGSKAAKGNDLAALEARLRGVEL